MKVRMGESEEYPVFWAEPYEKGKDPWPATITISRERWLRWKRVLKEYAKVQREIERAFDYAVAKRAAADAVKALCDAMNPTQCRDPGLLENDK